MLAHRLARQHVFARNEALGSAPEVDVDAVAVDALDDAAQHLVNAILVFLDDLRPLGLAHALHDDLLRRLRGDAAEFHRFDRHLDVAVDLGIGIDVHGIDHPEFALRFLELGRIVGEHLPPPERVVLAGFAVDGDTHVDVVTVTLARRGRQRGLHRLEDDLAVDALLVRDGLDHHQHFFTHCSLCLRPGIAE